MKIRETLRCVMAAFGAVAPAVVPTNDVRAAEAAPPPVTEQAEAAPAPLTPEQTYVAGLRAACEHRWTHNFVKMAERQLPATHPVNDASKRVVLDVAIAPGGLIKSVDVLTASGATELDSSAVDVAKDIRKVGVAPDGAISDDGFVHVAWVFERAKGRCEDATIIQKESPLAEALPRLLAQGREATAIARVTAVVANGAEPGVSLLARAWLADALTNRARSGVATLALAQAGDKDARARVAQDAAKSVEAARAVAAWGGDVCALAAGQLTGKPAEREAALRLLEIAGPGAAACAGKVVALAEDEAQPAGVRAAALRAIGSIGADAGRKVAQAAIESPSAPMRAAAAIAVGRPGAGKPALFKLTPLIKDSSVEVRAAAGAAMVRAAGEPAIEQLYLLWKESDPRPYTELAPELGKLSGAAAVDMLSKMLKRSAVEVRAGAAEALAGRRDVPARAALAVAGKDASPEVRVFALAVLPPAERAAAAAVGGPPGIRAFRAMLRAGDRDAAGAWLMANVSGMAAPERAARLGDWLAASTSDPKVTAKR